MRYRVELEVVILVDGDRWEAIGKAYSTKTDIEKLPCDGGGQKISPLLPTARYGKGCLSEEGFVATSRLTAILP